ncbi:Hypothetical predicted protein, partial [Paramuricea clavata]
SLRKQEKINEGYTTDANVAECSFAESATTAMEYRIRLVENVVMLNDGNVTMVSKSWGMFLYISSCLPKLLPVKVI